MNLQKYAALVITLFVTMIIGVCRPSCAATLKADYQFNDTYASSVGAAPALTDIGPGTNSLAAENVAGLTRTVLNFPQGSGLQISPTTNTINSSYSIVMLFRFNDASSYKRILDFKMAPAIEGFITTMESYIL